MSRLIEKLDEEEHLQPSDDGYVVYWTQQGGYLTAEHLREIADELDRRNKTWHEQVMQDVGALMPQIKSLVWKTICEKIQSHEALTPLGGFRYFRRLTGEWTAWADDHEWFDEEKHNTKPGDKFETEVDAKAWCQQEYERRVRECLE